jgi:uncharacterized membrane-anchored protein
VSSIVPVLVVLFSLLQQCQAQQQYVSQSDVSVDPLKYVNWISGPQKVTLGDFADINIPKGYRLTDVHGAKMVLESLNIPTPDELAGILAPTSGGKWMAVLQYSPKGYIKSPDVTKIDTTAVLKKVLEQINGKQDKSSVTSLNWQSQPSYDANNYLLEWSFQVATPSSAKVLNQTAVLLGRHGVLQVTIAQPSSLTGAPSLKQLISNINFKEGERYTDYQTGDKVAEIGLAELISGEKHAQTAGGFGAIAAWIYGGLAVCLVAGGVVVVIRRNKRQIRPQAPAQIPVPAVKNDVPAKAVFTTPPSPILKKSETNGHAQPKPVSSHVNGSKPFNRNRRKRVFDYPKFYTNVMRELSLYSYGPGNSTNGKSPANGHANGHTNGESNGYANGHAAVSNGSMANETIKSQIEELISTQKSLIQEQKCLLEQQTRLIEEKRWLIEEQTAFLKNQSGLTA